VQPTYFSNLAAIAILLTLGLNVTAEDSLRKSEPDSFVKLGDIKGDYRSEPDSFVKLGDIKGDYRSEPDSFVKLGDIKGDYRSEPDSFVKLGDIKGDYRSEPDSFVKLGDIKGEYKTETSKEELNDLLREYEYLIWEAEADDFFWGNQQGRPSEVLDRWIWGEESGDF